MSKARELLWIAITIPLENPKVRSISIFVPTRDPIPKRHEDLGDEPAAAQDVLSLSPFMANLNDPPVLLGFFNQLKQEFVSARWTYFEAMQTNGVRFFRP